MRRGIAIAALSGSPRPSCSRRGPRPRTVFKRLRGQRGGPSMPTVDAFLTSLGALNPNSAGAFASWPPRDQQDGVPDALPAPNLLPANSFQRQLSSRSRVRAPGTGFEVSATAATARRSSSETLTPSYTAQFSDLQPAAAVPVPLAARLTDVNFFIPRAPVARQRRRRSVLCSPTSRRERHDNRAVRPQLPEPRHLRRTGRGNGSLSFAGSRSRAAPDRPGQDHEREHAARRRGRGFRRRRDGRLHLREPAPQFTDLAFDADRLGGIRRRRRPGHLHGDGDQQGTGLGRRCHAPAST